MQQLSAEVTAILEAQAWPGNARELKNVVRQAVLESKVTLLQRPLLQRLLAHPAHPVPTQGTGRSLREAASEAAGAAERVAIAQALRDSKGNKSQAARALKTDYKTLHVKMKQLGLRAKDFTV